MGRNREGGGGESKKDWASPLQTLTQREMRFFMKTLYCAADQTVRDGEKHTFVMNKLFSKLFLELGCFLASQT